jgi:hypothetical protein
MSKNEPIILVREGKLNVRSAGPDWRQYMVVTDERVAVVHMVPALLSGWNFQRVDIQTGSDWEGMTRDRIVAWKFRHDDRARLAEDLSPEFRQKLLSRALISDLCAKYDAGGCPRAVAGEYLCPGCGRNQQQLAEHGHYIVGGES